MSRLLVKPSGDHGKVISITPQSAGWRHVGFEVQKLAPGESAAAATGNREVCLVLVSGKARAKAGGRDFGLIGERMTPFLCTSLEQVKRHLDDWATALDANPEGESEVESRMNRRE